MAAKFKYLQYRYDNTPLDELVGLKNSPHIPGGIIDKLILEFTEVNGEDATVDGNAVYVPILPPFYKKYRRLLERHEIDQEEEEEVVVKPPQVETPPVIPAPVIPPVYTPPTVPTVYTPPVKEEVKAEEIVPEPEPVVEPKKKKVKKEPPKERTSKVGEIQYKAFPYTFGRPGETIEAVLRLYNDMNVSSPVMKKLLYEFTKLNMDAIPPKLGQTVQVPVLLPFVFRHANENKIFNEA